MNPARILFHLVLADVRERTRRYGFLVTVAGTLYLGYLVADGTIGLRLGEYRGVMNAAWVGTLMALSAVTFVSLAGFYVVKNAVEGDRRTGVGQILAATPLGRVPYLVGKMLGNFVVLALVIAVLAAVATLLLWTRREEGTFDLVALLLPLVLLTLPAMLLVAALAVTFEATPGLRGGFGNLAYFCVWTALVVIPLQTGSLWTDALGMRLAMDRIQADVRALAPDYSGAYTLGIEGDHPAATTPLRWRGIAWTGADLGWRMLPVGAALVLLLPAALVFDRFDTAPRPARRRARTPGREGGARPWLAWPAHAVDRALAAVLEHSRFGRLLGAELRLMVHDTPWWWHLAAVALWVVALTQEPGFSRLHLLPWLWVWPVFLWSAMGTREQRHRTGLVLFSCPRPVARQLPAQWAAGVLLAFALAGGILVRLLLAGDLGGCLAVGAGALFVPSLALALGVWTGGSRAFEALYIVAWYVGPLQHQPRLDFIGTTDAAARAGTPLFCLLLAGVLLVAAWARRRAQVTALA